MVKSTCAPTALITLDAKHLRQIFSTNEDEAVVSAVINSFLDVCLANYKAGYDFDWDHALRTNAHDTYLEVALRGRVFNVIDSNTGNTIPIDWYSWFMEATEALNKYYRGDVIATVRYASKTVAVRKLQYFGHDQYLIRVLMYYNNLLTNEGPLK